MKQLFCLILCSFLFGCSVVLDGILESAHREVESIGAQEVHILTFNTKDSLYYIQNEFGTFKYTGKNFVKYNNGNVKEKSQFKNGKKQGKWLWYNQYGKRMKKETWQEGKLISSQTF